MKRAVLDALRQARDARVPAGLLVERETGRYALFIGDDAPIGDMAMEDEDDISAVRRLILIGISKPMQDGRFLLVRRLQARLIIVGAVHIAQILAAMAQAIELDVMIIDPRRGFATADRFPGIRLCHEWPDEAMARIRFDSDVAVITLTHDPKLDDVALSYALRAKKPFYIGALGSVRTHASRCERLRAEGFAEEAIGQIRAPIGLAIGAQTPAEIAVAILGQLIEHHRHG